MGIELYSGSEAIGTTEWSCTTDTAGPDVNTTEGEMVLVLDLSDMIAGDELQIRCYEKVLSSSTQRVLHQWTLVGAQIQPVWVSPPVLLKHGWDFTLDAIAGTITVDWSIRRSTVGDISAEVANKIADHVIRRSFSNAAGSSDGDTKTGRSLLGAIAKLVNKVSISGSSLTVTEANDTTTLFTQTLTATAGADPITAADTD